MTDDYDLEELLTQLGIGEAVVTTLTDDGSPAPVAWTKVRPPASQIGAVEPAEVRAEAEASDRWATYAVEIDRESARELLAARMGVEAPAPTPAPDPAPSPDDLVRDAGADDDLDARVPPPPDHRSPTKPRRAPRRAPADDDGNPVTDFLKSREGRATVNTVVRGVFDLLKKR